MNITNLINDSVDSECIQQPQFYDYLSYGLNILLLIATIYSEFAGLSKCKSNGILDGIVKKVNQGISNNELVMTKSGKLEIIADV